MSSQVFQISNSLKGKNIVLGVTGSIAAVKCIELAREIRRHGANVYAVMTQAAQKIIHPEAMKYATGNNVITEISGNVEHVEFCGINGKADIFLIAPCTANTIGKIANGIDDTTVTTFATTSIGSNIPIIIVPAMHESMYNHQILIENIKKLEKLKIRFINPIVKENAAKIPSNKEILLNLEREVSKKTFAGKRVIITSGATKEKIDPIRILTNRASGKTGIEIAFEFFRRGADVTIVHNKHLNINGIKEIYIETAQDMIDSVLNELEKGYDMLISASAISDFTVEAFNQKIKSDKDITLYLKTTPKLIKKARLKYPKLKIIGFKAEADVTKQELINRAKASMNESKLDMVVANDISVCGMGNDVNEVYIVNKDIKRVYGTKYEIAVALIDEIEKNL